MNTASFKTASESTELPRFILDMLAACPRAGEGVHAWLFIIARQLWAHRDRAEIIALLAATVAGCGRAVPLSEIESAVDSAKACAWQPGVGRNGFAPSAPVRTWPEVNTKTRAEIVADGGALVDLWGASPVRIETNDPRTEEIVDVLFPSDPLLCCGKTNSVFDTRTREEWRGELSRLALVVPSPMTARTGLTKDGKESKHTLANTGTRRFLVCEFDKGSADDHAALILHLATFAPLVCALHSGGKSMHSWFFVAGQPDEKVAKFFRYAVSLGADPKLWTRSQFCRLPDGTRDNGNRQTVYFLNFKPLEATR